MNEGTRDLKSLSLLRTPTLGRLDLPMSSGYYRQQSGSPLAERQNSSRLPESDEPFLSPFPSVRSLSPEPSATTATGTTGLQKTVSSQWQSDADFLQSQSALARRRAESQPTYLTVPRRAKDQPYPFPSTTSTPPMSPPPQVSETPQGVRVSSPSKVSSSGRPGGSESLRKDVLKKSHVDSPRQHGEISAGPHIQTTPRPRAESLSSSSPKTSRNLPAGPWDRPLLPGLFSGGPYQRPSSSTTGPHLPIQGTSPSSFSGPSRNAEATTTSHSRGTPQSLPSANTLFPLSPAPRSLPRQPANSTSPVGPHPFAPSASSSAVPAAYPMARSMSVDPYISRSHSSNHPTTIHHQQARYHAHHGSVLDNGVHNSNSSRPSSANSRSVGNSVPTVVRLGDSPRPVPQSSSTQSRYPVNGANHAVVRLSDSSRPLNTSQNQYRSQNSSYASMPYGPTGYPEPRPPVYRSQTLPPAERPDSNDLRYHVTKGLVRYQ